MVTENSRSRTPGRARLAWAWTVVVVALCLIPGSWLHERSPDLLPVYLQADKLVHFGMFLLFGWLWARVGSSGKRGWQVLAWGLLLAVATELAQGLPVVDRDPDLLDVLADAIGTLVGIGLSLARRGAGTSDKSSGSPN